MTGPTLDQVHAELQRIKADQEALDRQVQEGTVTAVEQVRRAAALDIRLDQLRRAVEDQVVARTTIPDFPPTG